MTFPRTAVFLAGLAGVGCMQSQSLQQSGAPGPQEGRLVVARHVEHIDTVARELAVIQHPNGTLFVAGYGGIWTDSFAEMQRLHSTYWRSRLWKSADSGATWARVDVGPGAKGVIGNSDVSLAESSSGTIYFVTMTYDGAKGEGQGMSVGVSHDAGTTWKWSVLSHNRFDDRPWVVVAPDGTAHVIWNDGAGVQHVMSHDDGATWSPPVRIYDKGGSSHLAVGPSGELAVRISSSSASGNSFDRGVDLLAISTDAGITWRTSASPGNRTWTAPDSAEVVPRWVEPVAWDAKGRLYSLWTDTSGVWLARSSDRGAQWTVWQLVHCSEVCYYPYLIARADGDLAATWMSGKDDALRWNAAKISASASTDRPVVALSGPLEMNAWFPDREHHLHRDTGGEYLTPIFLRSGDIGVATVIQAPDRQGFEWWRLAAK